MHIWSHNTIVKYFKCTWQEQTNHAMRFQKWQVEINWQFDYQKDVNGLTTSAIGVWLLGHKDGDDS